MARHTANGETVGDDVPDPFFFDETRHLLSGESHRRALRCLDDFLVLHEEKQIRDPFERAMLQHDLWAVFDWAARARAPDARQRTALVTRLAQVIRRLALTPEEIRRLPDTYASADLPGLPRDLFAENGPWVCLTGHHSGPVAINHFSGRSRFLVFMQLPGGRRQTLDYVRKLADFQEPPLIKRGRFDMLNLKLPQFPAGTSVALVRQMILIDAGGNLVATPVTETVQVRVYPKVTAPSVAYMNLVDGPASHGQSFFEFRLSRRSGALTAVRPGDREYLVLFSQGFDPYESPPPFSPPPQILETCRDCHSDSGIHSVQSRQRWIGDRANAGTEDAVRWETDRTMDLERRTPEFRMLLKLWRAAVTPTR